MQFSIDRQQFYKLLQRAQSIVSKNDIHESISQHVKIEVRDNNVYLTAMNDSLYLTTMITNCVNIQTPGSICVKFARLFNIIKVLGSDVCNITVNDLVAGPMVIQNGHTDVTIDSCRAASDYPKSDESNEEIRLDLIGSSLKRIITETVFSVGTRQGLNGIHIDIRSEENMLRFVSTDGNRMSWSAAPLTDLWFDSEQSTVQQHLLPIESIQEIKKLCPDDEACRLLFGPHGFVFETEESRLQGSVLGGKFPPYEKTLNTLYKSVPNKAVLERVKTSAICDRVKTISMDKEKASLNMLFEQEEVVFSMTENGKRIFEDHLNMDFEGNDVHIAFKCQYFQDVLKSLESEFILLNLGRGENDACIVRVPERNDCEFIIMPMKIN